MHSHRINFAAALAAISILACSPAGTTSRTDSDSPPNTATLTPPDPVVVAGDRGRTNGDSSATTWLVIVSDFQCPYCRQWHDQTYHALVDEYVRTGKIRVAYLNYPLNQHHNAIPTASGAMCAAAQGKFWEYHSALFDTQTGWSRDADPVPQLRSIARNLGLDMDAWTQCYESNRMVPLIHADRNRASSGGVRSTPSFLVGGKILEGTMSLAMMRPHIDSAIAKNRGSGAPQ